MKNKTLISIVIPIYNAEKYLDRCIESIVNQTYKNIEILLIDDGSTDSSSDLCDTWKNKDERIVVIHKKNSGVSDTRNLGIEKSCGKYITFIDSDDYIDETMIEKLYVNLLENNSDISICGFKRITDKGKILYESSKKKIVLNNKTDFLNELMRENLFIGSLWGKLYKKELFKDNKLDKSLRIAEDLDLLIRIGQTLKKISVVGENLYYYFDNEESVTKTANFDKYSDEIKVLEKNLDNSDIDRELIMMRYIRINTCLFFDFRKTDKENAKFCNINIKKIPLKMILCRYVTFKQKIKFLLVKLNLVR